MKIVQMFVSHFICDTIKNIKLLVLLFYALCKSRPTETEQDVKSAPLIQPEPDVLISSSAATAL